MRPFLLFTLAASLVLGRRAHAVQPLQPGPNYTVTNATDTDDGACYVTNCTLRDAINAANANADANSITFDSTAFASPQTITLTNSFPAVIGSVTLTGSAAGVTLNTSNGGIGLLCISGTINLINLTFVGNSSAYGVQSSQGGANLTLRGCTFTGLYNGLYFNGGTIQVQNCTFSGNDTAIRAITSSAIDNSTLSGNRIGLSLSGGTSTVSNSIIAGNTTNISNPTELGTYSDGGHNLATNGLTAAQAGLDPAGLQSNGGPTQTIALQSTSPAINAGDPTFDVSSLRYDQRGPGYRRKFGSAIDIGAFELQPTQTAPTALALLDNTVATGKPSGTYVGTFATTDADAGDSFTYSFATGAGDDDNASFTINSAGSLRTTFVADIATKSSYSILVKSTDATGFSITQQFTVTVTESVPPSLTVASPTANQKVPLTSFDGSLITGTANDNVAVVAVKVRLGRMRNGVNSFWNGTDFVTNSSTVVDADVTGAGTPSATWSVATHAPPQNKLDAGTYDLRIYAVDEVANKSAYVGGSFTLTSAVFDVTKPTVTITSPTNNQIVNINNVTGATFSGNATDNLGVTAVKLKLQRKRNNVLEYWNGTAFTTTVTLFDAAVTTAGDASVTWQLAQPIPASQLDKGGYTLYATAYDAAGNFLTSPSRPLALTGATLPATVSKANSSANGS